MNTQIHVYADTDVSEYNISMVNNPSIIIHRDLDKFIAEPSTAKHAVFHACFPYYSDAENAGSWTRPCSYDFSLTVGNRKYLIDVAGPDARGSFGKRGRKHPTDIHLLCRIAGDQCVWEGVVGGEGYKESIDPRSIFSPTAFVVWLNCANHGIDYRAVAPGTEAAA